jgi:hypothetical protein
MVSEIRESDDTPGLNKSAEAVSAQHQQWGSRDAKTKMCFIHALHREHSLYTLFVEGDAPEQTVFVRRR